MHVHEALLPEDIGLVNAILCTGRAIEEGLLEHVDEVDYNLYALRSNDNWHGQKDESVHSVSDVATDVALCDYTNVEVWWDWEYELLDIKDVKGTINVSVRIRLLWDKWREMGILEGLGPMMGRGVSG
ncbi:hypothetical protein V8E55_011800 [Tylopilus felleus]